jgi:hypothetical protein
MSTARDASSWLIGHDLAQEGRWRGPQNSSITSNTLINFLGSPYVAICTRGKILWQRDPRDVFWAMEDTQTIRQNQMGQRGKEFWQNRGFI